MKKRGHVIFRIDPKKRSLIDRAAKIDGRSTSDFFIWKKLEMQMK